MLDNFSSEDLNKILTKFNTVEQRALQGRIIENFNVIAILARGAPPKKQVFLKEASNFNIAANEFNHCGWVEFGNKATAVCGNLLEFVKGVGEGVWQSGVGLVDMVRNYDQTFQSLTQAAR